MLLATGYQGLRRSRCEKRGGVVVSTRHASDDEASARHAMSYCDLLLRSPLEHSPVLPDIKGECFKDQVILERVGTG